MSGNPINSVRHFFVEDLAMLAGASSPQRRH